MSASDMPLLAVTMGDPAGVGPEVVVGAWDDAYLHESVRLIVLGHAEILRRAAQLLHRDIRVKEVATPAAFAAVKPDRGTIFCLQTCDDAVIDVPPGRVDARAGEAAYQAVRRGAEMAIAREVDGIVTAPLSKAALHAAGHHYPGHTELLAELCGVNDFAMMLYLGRETGARHERGEQEKVATLRTPSPVHSVQSGWGVVHVTLHQSLRSIFADLTSDAIVAKCRLVDGVMRRLGVAAPRLAVCALNPHAGEDSLFGDEEQTIISPAVDAARRAGFNVAGPFPTDTLMARARDGEFDAVVAMYHDQGHIAVKLLAMHTAVNITLGLPIVRTSVAHGTAFDRAWQGTARAEGMVAAIWTAARLAASQK